MEQFFSPLCHRRVSVPGCNACNDTAGKFLRGAASCADCQIEVCAPRNVETIVIHQLAYFDFVVSCVTVGRCLRKFPWGGWYSDTDFAYISRSYYQIAATNDRSTGIYRLEMDANAEADEVELAPDFLKLVVPFWLAPLY